MKQAAVTLDIEKGDTLLGGRFKNHKTVVETLGTDSLGQPTVNGMKLLAFRIAKKMPKEAYTMNTKASGALSGVLDVNRKLLPRRKINIEKVLEALKHLKSEPGVDWYSSGPVPEGISHTPRAVLSRNPYASMKELENAKNAGTHQEYAQGFMDKCAEFNIDPAVLLKSVLRKR